MRARKASTSSGARRFFEALKLRAATTWDVIYDAIKNFSANGDTNQAAAVSLYTILSAIPLFILTIIVAANVFTSYPLLQDDILDAIRSFNPYFSEKLMEQLGHIETKKNLLGSLGLLGLLWLAAAIFSVMETALNIIFRSPKKRNYFASKLLAISMIPLGWTLGAASLIVSSIAAFLMAQPFILPGGIEVSLGAAAGFLLRYVIPYIVTVVFFFFLYWIIPTAKNRLLVLLAGSAFFAFLMEIAKQLFAWYIANYTRYGLIFGTLEPVVILALWVFYVALIFLFCAELMASYQRRDLLLLERAMLKPHKSYLKVDERLFKKFGRVYPQGKTIFNEGDKGNEMFYILSGRVRLEKEAGQVKKTLMEMGQGQYFGEMAALIDAPRTAKAMALEDSNLAVSANVGFLAQGPTHPIGHERTVAVTSEFLAASGIEWPVFGDQVELENFRTRPQPAIRNRAPKRSVRHDELFGEDFSGCAANAIGVSLSMSGLSVAHKNEYQRNPRYAPSSNQSSLSCVLA